MADFDWKDSYATGHPGIDAQHRELFALARAVALPLLASPASAPSAQAVRALLDYTTVHFRFEEDLMRAAGYPESARHAKYHEALLTELKTFCARLDRGGSPQASPVVDFLWHWLLVHIDTADRDLAAWVGAHAPAAG
jgi:hemerythrin